ncbi:hypothetical protein Tco_1161921, partial [Tanacetum coccineum]
CFLLAPNVSSLYSFSFIVWLLIFASELGKESLGAFEVDVSLEGDIILCRQVDQAWYLDNWSRKKSRLKILKKIGESRGVKEVVFLAL